MDQQIKERLVASGLVTREQLASAQEKALATNQSLQSVLVHEKHIDATALGHALASLYRLPHSAILNHKTPSQRRAGLSARCARAWKVYPVDCNPQSGIITIAVSDLEQALKVERIYDFLLDEYDLAFEVASEPEIEKAIETAYGSGKHRKQKSEQESNEQADATPKAAPKKKLTSLREHMKQRAKEEKEEPPKTPSETDKWLQALTNSASLIVAAHLGDNTPELASVRARARYCGLIATRMGLSQQQTSTILISAWFSGLKHKPDVIDRFDSPLDIKSLIFADEMQENMPTEGLILTLVCCYQELEKERPESCRDVGLVRRGLLTRWSGAQKYSDILEVFLQVLMDEQFLEQLDREGGKILLVDPSGGITSEIETPLRKTGYQVDVISDPNTVTDAISREKPEVIILYADGATGQRALKLCRELTHADDHLKVPLIAVVSEDSPARGAEFLRNGADDFLSAPVDMELLFLRIEKRMEKTERIEAETEAEGVTGTLSDLNLSDMLQVLSAGARSMEISLKRGEESGHLYLKEGNVIDVRVGALTGENAFYQLMRWQDGEFSMKECSEFPEPTITASTMSLLMEGARLADEAADA